MMMTFKQFLLIILSVFIGNHKITCISNLSEITNLADLYDFENLNKTVQTIANYRNISTKANTANVYDFSRYLLDKTISTTRILHEIKTNKLKNSIATPNHSYSQQKRNTTNNSALASNGLVGAVAELYMFSSASVMGLFNCSYENTINITNYSVLSNGSYIYDNHTIIPANLVGNYDYEILYDGSKRTVPQHKRACICHLKHCITLCSASIIQFYQDVKEDGKTKEFRSLFAINVTLTNKTVVTKNIAQDFAHIVLDEFCQLFYKLSPEKEEDLAWTLFENGTLLRHSDQVQLKNMEYCFELYQDKFNNESYYFINPLNCAKPTDDLRPIDKINYWTQVVSLPFFVLTIIAYCSLPELYDVHGKCFMSYLSSLTISYALLSYINLSENTFDPIPCLIMGYLNHYMQLCHYTWLGIICFDTWKTFEDHEYKASYCKYATYGYSLPLLVSFITYVVQNSKIDEDYKPGISEFRCGLEVNKWAASIYLYGPCLIILFCCLILFILIYKIIETNDKKVSEMQGFECPRARYSLYFRLFLMMGLSWFLDVISYLLNMGDMRYLSGIIDYINALQGFYIFANFIGQTRVRNIIRDKSNKRKRLREMR